MSRWLATIHYRTDAGLVDVDHELDEVEELHDLIERGPHWDTIELVELRRAVASRLTVEQAKLQ